MRIACVRIPCFTVAVERRANPQLEEQPLVVYDRSDVIDASQEATGVQRGLPLRQAKALCPRAVFAQANVSLYRDVAEAMLDAIEEVSPQVEEAEAGAAYADVGGLEGHYENEFALAGSLIEAVRQATGLLAAAGVAEGKFASWVAASMTTPGDAGIVPSGKEQEFLRDKPVTFLPAELETLQRLDLLALTTLGDVATLPQTAVEAQFRSPRLWELANGIDRDALRPRKRQEILRERLSFDAPVAVSEALVLASKQLLRRLVRRLRGRTARRMHIQLLADERIVWEKLETFREPTSDERLIMLVIKTRLSLLELPQAIDTVAISLTGIGRETAKQTKLFTDTKNLNQIADAIKQLQARYGRPMIWRVKEVDPSSRHPEERSALIPYDA